MDIRHLTYFIEVAKQKSFTRASEVLCLSQPTLSKMVKNLEEAMDVELLDRSSKKVVLTVAGEIVFEEGQKILNSFQDLSSLVNDMMNLKKGKLKIGVPPLIAVLYYPKIIREFKELYPGITVQLIEKSAAEVRQDVKDGALDFGVDLLPVEGEFDVVPSIDEEMMLFVHHSHPLAAKEEVSLIEIKGESFVYFQESSKLRQLVDQECSRLGFLPTISYESYNWELISEMVAENLGITIFPKSVVKKVDLSRVKAIPIVNPTISWKLGIILNKEKYVSYAAKEMIKYITSQFR
ncbi:LysR family transcriptional regulator [Niallia oryzisoli]|uniref:LysR family transcriptional regulator n=1 Tax=Niallia oryzisoli TaxID=1737571 RepID=A0ABZ2CM13_9BACI